MTSRSEVRQALRQNRLQVMVVDGHTWDVADVLDVLDDAGMFDEDDEQTENETAVAER